MQQQLLEKDGEIQSIKETFNTKLAALETNRARDVATAVQQATTQMEKQMMTLQGTIVEWKESLTQANTHVEQAQTECVHFREESEQTIQQLLTLPCAGAGMQKGSGVNIMSSAMISE